MRPVTSRARWDVREAGTTDLDHLVYRSRHLGADPTIVNWKGGNTSAKATVPDHMARPVRVLWVKGSGSDLRTIRSADFAGLRLDEIVPLQARPAMSDEEMVDYLLRCRVHPQQPRPSIETLLHAFLPFAHVDHTHPDSVLAFCTTRRGEARVTETFGDRVIWIPYQRPGFALAKAVADVVHRRPQAEAVFLAKHGLVTWGATSEQCYESTLRILAEAERVLESRSVGRRVFGAVQVPPLSAPVRTALLAAALPMVRGMVAGTGHKILHVQATDDVLTFVGGADGAQLSQIGSACPDHLVHTKHRPLFVPFDPRRHDQHALQSMLLDGWARYVTAQQADEAACRHPGDSPGNPAPRIVLIPGVGLIATGNDKHLAMRAAGLYRQAIQVMRGASALDAFESLSAQEAYDVEYWPLERYKLTLAPPRRELAGRIALVTGAAGGVGRVVAARLAEEGAHVALADEDLIGAQDLAGDLRSRFGEGRACAVRCDVTDKSSVADAFTGAILAYGGLDICVTIASAVLEETLPAPGRPGHDVRTAGDSFVARHALQVMNAQGLGGTLVFVVPTTASMPSVEAVSPTIAAATPREEPRIGERMQAPGIRVNAVSWAAGVEGSRIGISSWRAVAEAVLFFASDRSVHTTGRRLVVSEIGGADVR